MQCFNITFGQSTLNIQTIRKKNLCRSTVAQTFQSKLIFPSEKTNSCQQLTYSANSEAGRLVSLLLSGHKSMGSQPTSLCLMNNSRQSQSFIDDVSIDSWQCRLEIDKVKSKKTKNEPIASHSTIQSEPIASRSTNQIK
jgi:hypothetical protein